MTPVSSEWFVGRPGTRVDGPYTLEQVRERLRAGQLDELTQLTRDQKSWHDAKELLSAAEKVDPSSTKLLNINANTQPDELPAGTVIGGYEIIGVLGSGGMGVVYRARQTALDRVVALKMVRVLGSDRDKLMARFGQEAQAVGKLRHPNIITAYDFGRHDGSLYFVMELLDGESLDARLNRAYKLDEPTAWGIIRQAAAGLAHAAERGIIHRDIKPGNLFLTPPPTGYPLPEGLPLVKVMDFGLAMLHAGGDTASVERLTTAGMVVGTPLYMAPEQFESNKPIDHRTDIYALGVTAFRLVTGQPPFRGEGVWDLMLSKLEGPAEAVGVSDATAALLRDMMARKVEDRVADYAELFRRINGIVGASVSYATLELPPASGALKTAEMTRPAKVAPPAPAVTDRPKWGRLALGGGLIALATVVGAYVLATADFGGAIPPPPLVANDKSTQELFRGKDIDDWKIIEKSWQPGKDSEGGTVLAGEGLICRPFWGEENYRVTANGCRHQAKAIELQFGLGKPDQFGDRPRWAIRLDEADAKLVMRTGAKGKFEAVGRSVPVADQGEAKYVQLRAEKHGSWWYAYVNDDLLGRVADAGEKLPEFYLMAEGGTAWFESLAVTRLEKP